MYVATNAPPVEVTTHPDADDNHNHKIFSFYVFKQNVAFFWKPGTVG